MSEEEATHFNLTPVEFSCYYAYFHRIVPRGEKLSGGRAREFFLQTRLSPELLSAIWKLSDIDQDGCLNAAEFPLAMLLVQQNLKGVPLPLYLPNELYNVYMQAMKPQLPVATDAHLGKCKKAFEAFRQNIGKGVLGGDAARYLLTKSNLTKEQLYHIWKLSDIDEDGHLTFKEFTVAMHLLFIAKLGCYLPVDLDPNTVLPPSFHDVIRKVQAEAERLPMVDQDHVPIQPFSPPTSPIKQNPPLGENPFISDEIVNLPARRFREGDFENFSGDPFESVELFREPLPHPTNTSHSDSDSLLQQFQVNTGSVESISQESQESQAHSHSSGIENEDRESLEQHDYYTLEVPSQNANQAHISERNVLHQDPELSSRESVNLSQTSSVTESGSEKSSPSSGTSGRRKKIKSSVESLQDVVVTEREEPVLQLAKSVDVIGSREVTPIPDVGEEESSRWVSPGQVQAELEELSRASRKFLEETKSKLVGQQKRNLHYASGINGGMGEMNEELRAASRKGLNVTIQEMTEEEEDLPDKPENPVNPMLKSSTQEHVSEAIRGELEEVRVEGDMMAHLDNLEAEIWAALDESEQLDVTDNSTTSGGVAVGVAAPASANVKDTTNTVAGEKLEVKRTVAPLTGNKKVKVTSVQVNIRRSSRTEEPRKVQSQPQPVKQVVQDPKPVNTKRQPPVAQQYKPEPVKLRRPHESVVKQVVKEIKREKTNSASRKEARRSQVEEGTMVDIDSFLEGELASINEVLEQFQTDDKKAKQRNLEEEKLLESKNATDGVVLPEVSVEALSRRRQVESQNIEEQWEAEMKRLEEERLQALQREEELKKMIETDEVVLNLDKELQSLIAHEEEMVKETQKEKELRLQREKEERERKEREKQERKLKQVENQEELSVEEWIAWMEEKKKQGMTPEQQAEYERRKKAHLEREREREMKRKQEIEEKMRKTREMMLAEQKAFSQRDSEVKSSRVTEEELRQMQEENARKEAVESQLRKERAKQKLEEIKQREMDEATPKARSALAARWEEKIKTRGGGGKISTTENKTTVMSDSLEREKQRMARIISPSSQNGDESS